MNALNDLSTEVRFRERMRGYDFEEVDSYVKAVSRAVAHGRDQISDLQQRLAQAEPSSGNGDGLSETREMLLRTLVLAQRTADTAIAEARTEAKSITDSAQERAAKTVAEAEAAANERLRSSEERAEQTLAEAEENCQLILSEAKRTAATELAVERARKIEEIEALEATRADLEAATAAIQARLDSERWQLRNLATSFQSFVEQFEPVTDPADPADGLAGSNGSALDIAVDEATEPGEADPVAEVEDEADPDAQPESAIEFAPDTGDEAPAAEQADDESPAARPDPDDEAPAAEQADDEAPAAEQTLDAVASADAVADGPTTDGLDDDAPADLPQVGWAEESADTDDGAAGSAHPTELAGAEQAHRGSAGPHPGDGPDAVAVTATHSAATRSPELFDIEAEEDDEFIEQLRQVVSSDAPLPSADAAMAAFFDHDEGHGRGGRLGQRA